MNEPENFEQQLEQIDTIVADLESGELSLDQMLSRYESGMRLIATCQQRLANAELKVTEITELTELTASESTTTSNDVSDDDDWLN